MYISLDLLGEVLPIFFLPSHGSLIDENSSPSSPCKQDYSQLSSSCLSSSMCFIQSAATVHNAMNNRDRGDFRMLQL